MGELYAGPGYWKVLVGRGFCAFLRRRKRSSAVGASLAPLFLLYLSRRASISDDGLLVGKRLGTAAGRRVEGNGVGALTRWLEPPLAYGYEFLFGAGVALSSIAESILSNSVSLSLSMCSVECARLAPLGEGGAEATKVTRRKTGNTFHVQAIVYR